MKASAPFTREEWAARLAAALISTTERYVAGLMVRATYRSHFRALWNQVQAAGVDELVLARIKAEEVQ